jgi:hypothetical protein
MIVSVHEIHGIFVGLPTLCAGVRDILCLNLSRNRIYISYHTYEFDDVIEIVLVVTIHLIITLG